MDSAINESVQHEEASNHTGNARLSDETPRRAVCGRDTVPLDRGRPHGPGDRRSLEDPFVQAKRRVWDLVNAGPRRRFTVEGLLVHNCLILDHAGNVYRHGLPTEPEEFTLDGIARRSTGETVPSIRTCPLCLAVTAGGTPVCPACGEPFPERKRSILVKKGELAAVGAWAQTASVDRRVELYAKWERVAREKKYRPGYAASVFRAAFGAWPDESVKVAAAALGVNG